jgi:chaperonin GroES
MNKIQPVNGYVLIRFDERKETKTPSGIIVPGTVEEKKTKGTIEAIAADAPKTLSVGDRVLYKEFSGTELKHEGVDYLLIESGDILAKFVEVDQI